MRRFAEHYVPWLCQSPDRKCNFVTKAIEIIRIFWLLIWSECCAATQNELLSNRLWMGKGLVYLRNTSETYVHSAIKLKISTYENVEFSQHWKPIIECNNPHFWMFKAAALRRWHCEIMCIALHDGWMEWECFLYLPNIHGKYCHLYIQYCYGNASTKHTNYVKIVNKENQRRCFQSNQLTQILLCHRECVCCAFRENTK